MEEGKAGVVRCIYEQVVVVVVWVSDAQPLFPIFWHVPQSRLEYLQHRRIHNADIERDTRARSAGDERA